MIQLAAPYTSGDDAKTAGQRDVGIIPPDEAFWTASRLIDVHLSEDCEGDLKFEKDSCVEGSFFGISAYAGSTDTHNA